MQSHETEKEKQINLSALWKPKPILKSSNCIKWKWYVTYSMEIWFSLFIIEYCLIVKPNRTHYTDYHQKYSRKLDFFKALYNWNDLLWALTLSKNENTELKWKWEWKWETVFQQQPVKMLSDKWENCQQRHQKKQSVHTVLICPSQSHPLPHK